MFSLSCRINYVEGFYFPCFAVPVAVCGSLQEAKSIAEYYSGELTWSVETDPDSGEDWTADCNVEITDGEGNGVVIHTWEIEVYRFGKVISTGWFDYDTPRNLLPRLDDERHDTAPVEDMEALVGADGIER